MTETFYDVLGVTEDATTDEIQSAYRDRLKEVHPDVSDDDDAGETTQRLVEARDVLVDEDERARYDRLGHEPYVTGNGSTVASAAESVTETDADADAETDEAAGGPRESPRDRAQRERRASRRVRQERAREAESTTQETTADGTTTRGAAADAATADGTTDRQGYGANAATGGASTYDVRTNVTTARSFGPILPTGHRLTLLAIFFVLYPLLLFSALLPAFPLFVNVTVGFCALIIVGYLQSMPRISLLVFGGWSAVGVLLMLVLGIEVVSLLGMAILVGTVLPFSFSLLTAWALRY
jgi:curved DNA-binding protein CbpA